MKKIAAHPMVKKAKKAKKGKKGKAVKQSNPNKYFES